MPVKTILRFHLILEPLNEGEESIHQNPITIERDLNPESTSEEHLKVAYGQVTNAMRDEFKTKFDAKINLLTEKEKENYSIIIKREKRIIDSDSEEQDLYVFEGGDVGLDDNLQGDNVIHQLFITNNDFIRTENTPTYRAALRLGENMAAGVVAVGNAANQVAREVVDFVDGLAEVSGIAQAIVREWHHDQGPERLLHDINVMAHNVFGKNNENNPGNPDYLV